LTDTDADLLAAIALSKAEQSFSKVRSLPELSDKDIDSMGTRDLKEAISSRGGDSRDCLEIIDLRSKLKHDGSQKTRRDFKSG